MVSGCTKSQECERVCVCVSPCLAARMMSCEAPQRGLENENTCVQHMKSSTSEQLLLQQLFFCDFYDFSGIGFGATELVHGRLNYWGVIACGRRVPSLLSESEAPSGRVKCSQLRFQSIWTKKNKNKQRPPLVCLGRVPNKATSHE